MGLGRVRLGCGRWGGSGRPEFVWAKLNRRGERPCRNGVERRRPSGGNTSINGTGMARRRGSRERRSGRMPVAVRRERSGGG
eukprot:10462341-Alexandrium_andersonii.AAC.1